MSLDTPGNTKFFKIWVLVAVPLTTKIEAASSPFCPELPHSLANMHFNDSSKAEALTHLNCPIIPLSFAILHEGGQELGHETAFLPTGRT